MIGGSSLERVAEPLARAEELSLARRLAALERQLPQVPPALTVALSREVGARGTSVARELGARLGWQVYDHELLERVAQDMRSRVELLESVDERQISWLQECLEAFRTSPTICEAGYVCHLVETVITLGARGHCVIVGRAAVHILPPATTLRVRLFADWEDRLAAISQERGLSRPEAAEYVKETERRRTGFTREHFHKDPTDPRHYDLILNTSRLPLAECAELLENAARRMESRVSASRIPVPIP